MPEMSSPRWVPESRSPVQRPTQPVQPKRSAPGPWPQAPGPRLATGVGNAGLRAGPAASSRKFSDSAPAQLPGCRERRAERSARRKPTVAVGLGSGNPEGKGRDGFGRPSGDHVCTHAALFLVCPNGLGHPFRFRAGRKEGGRRCSLHLPALKREKRKGAQRLEAQGRQMRKARI